MEHEYVVEWTDRAIEEYENLAEYLFIQWGENIAMKSLSGIDYQISRISRHPDHFPIFVTKNEIRRCVASPQTSVFFIVRDNKVVLLSIFDNRLNPAKRPG